MLRARCTFDFFLRNMVAVALWWCPPSPAAAVRGASELGARQRQRRAGPPVLAWRLTAARSARPAGLLLVYAIATRRCSGWRAHCAPVVGQGWAPPRTASTTVELQLATREAQMSLAHTDPLPQCQRNEMLVVTGLAAKPLSSSVGRTMRTPKALGNQRGDVCVVLRNAYIPQPRPPAGEKSRGNSS